MRHGGWIGVRQTPDRWTDLHFVNTFLQGIETVGLKLMETMRRNGLNRCQDERWNKTRKPTKKQGKKLDCQNPEQDEQHIRTNRVDADAREKGNN